MSVGDIYGGKVRVRACGLLFKEDKLLLLKHSSLGPKGYLWAPPGGGVDFGVNARETLRKEFLEETGLEVSVKEFLFINEYRDPNYHAVELFFRVIPTGGVVKLGHDPELPADDQILTELAFISEQEVAQMDPETLHNILREKPDFEDLNKLQGFFEFQRT